MIKAALAPGGQISVTADEATLRIIQRIPGAKKAKGSLDTWTLPFSMDTCAELRTLNAQMTDELAEAVRRAEKIEQYVSGVKTDPGETKPISPPPLREGCQMYQHQVRAYNITLALFYLQQYGGRE